MGKTEVARALAAATGARLIRLQCHEGIDVSQALYDWDYGRQLLALRAAEGSGAPSPAAGGLFSREFLVRRPLLEALEHPGPAVLLIDEVDRADDEFEAFLLELLSDFQVTIPELGTIAAVRRPLVVMTSNRTRELHDALKRRCLYHWIDYPSREREAEIVRARLPGVPDEIAARVCDAVERLRGEELYKLPGVGETIAWARALLALGDGSELDRDARSRAEGPRGHRARAREPGAGRCLRYPAPAEPRGPAAHRLGPAVTARIGLLAASLRAGGVRVGLGEVVAAHRALGAVDPASREDARLALRAALCARARRSSTSSTPRSRRASAHGEDDSGTPLSDMPDEARLVLPRTAVPDVARLRLEAFELEPVPRRPAPRSFCGTRTSPS